MPKRSGVPRGGKQVDREAYRRIKKEVQREVAKAQTWSKIYEELETPEGERKIFKIAKARDKAVGILLRLSRL